MNKYVVEYLTTNRYGGLEDREVIVRAATLELAKAVVQLKNPNAAIGYAELVSA